MKRLRTSLGILQLFIGLGALPSGLLMMLYPDGSGLGLPPDLIAGTPFTDYFIPGLFLLLINGLLQLAGALSTFKENPFAGKAGIYLGIMLMGWVAVQVWFIGLVSFLQTFYFVLGAVEVFLGVKLLRRLKTQE